MPADTNHRPVVTRFAPSPTGALHIGGARTALFAWAYARGHSGKFILRIEDTDLKRSSPESTRGIIRDLVWLGLMWDEGPKGPCMKQACDCGKGPDEDFDPYNRQVGDNGPYFQSQRAEQGLYDHYIQLLLDAGEAYEEDGAVRLKMGGHRGDIAFDDAVYGHIEVKAEDLEDFVIRKGDDGGRLPTFHFAVVCDDALMGVTHVIRGQEHLSNTTKHAAIYDALAKLTNDAVTWARPTWVHTPSIMNPGGSKMSKRDKAKAARQAAKIAKIAKIAKADGIDAARFDAFIDADNNDNDITLAIAHKLGLKLPEIDVNDFLESGYLPGVCLNYIALLGWNPGDNQEKFDLDFLSKHFDFDRVGKANSTFDRDKLRSFNGDAIRELSKDDFACELGGYVKNYRPDWQEASVFNGDDWQTFCTAVQERAETLPQPLDANTFLIAEDDGIEYDFAPKPIRKAMTNSNGAGVKLLGEVRAAFDGLPEDNFGHTAHEKINELAEAAGINMGKYAQPVRIAVAGSPVTPPLDVTLDLLGKSSTLERIDRCLAAAKAHMESQA
ncbi:MAG: glutamate--tRNA ligase [Phycisphaeraceae bacterium]|nr:glutamate--tRNA ligase [Phycisphaeraceae bacterium]